MQWQWQWRTFCVGPRKCGHAPAKKARTALEPMDTTLILGLLVVVVVGFFAYQWWTASSRRRGPAGRGRVSGPVGMASPVLQEGSGGEAAPVTTAPPAEEKYPVIAGQTETEMRAKEPNQRPVAATVQEPVTFQGDAPADFKDTLRRPEQSFHPVTGGAPTLVASDVPAGRAAVQSTPLSGHQQPFSPEMAQNGGALIGGHVFAFDGMEPTEFSAF